MAQTSASLEQQEQKTPALSEVLSTLSFALDLTEGAAPGHGVRSCLLALRIGHCLGLDSSQMESLYYAALLKDVGCSSNAARMCQITGGDDRAVKAGVKLEDWSRPHQPRLSTVKLLWEQVLPGQNAYRKAQRMIRIAATQHENNREIIQLRCDRGASIVRKIGLGEEVAQAVRHLDEHWDGSGYPGRLQGNGIPLLSRILGIAQHLDAFCVATGPQRAIDVMMERTKRWFDPEGARATLSLHSGGRLWAHCLPADGHAIAYREVLGRQPDGGDRLAAGSLDQICEAFAEVVDAKSPFTYRHSVGVKDAAMMIGQSLGLSQPRLQLLRRAALLHDIGKLSVSNLILDKPGKLDAAEFRVMKRHSAITRDILSRMPSFLEIAVIAGEHHEKLDGSGYPHGLRANDLSLESRLIAVADVYGALSEDRPYRPALDPAEIASIMRAEVPGKLDPQCFEALEMSSRKLSNWPAAPKIPALSAELLAQPLSAPNSAAGASSLMHL